ncbi:hypothetical protein L6452_34601 [Arctium lappa]|uniref:Uncharacterized protein n=1 Tax=Arctium lappa TaxID=4217 RepID=A0ACB8YK78_ARCLA|nr:hypothetical protein L6452_34601 [Arctium lappa]
MSWDVEFVGEIGPAEEAVGDHEGDRSLEVVEGLFEVGFDEFCGRDEGEEEGHGGEFFGAFDAGGDVLREGEGDDGGGGVGEATKM